MVTKTVDQLIDDVIAREGDYTNNPADKGGPTRWGTTEEVARAHGYKADMRALPRATAAAIYREQYWTNPHLDQVTALAPAIAAELFDTGINMGTGVAIGFMQRALNALNRGASDYPDIKADQQIGPTTLFALKGFLAKRGPTGAVVLLKAMEALQGAEYVALSERRPANEAFLYGWLANRVGLAS